MGSQDFKGRYSLLYFGFSYCPDICPTELKKMGRALDLSEELPNVPKVRVYMCI